MIIAPIFFCVCSASLNERHKLAMNSADSICQNTVDVNVPWHPDSSNLASFASLCFFSFETHPLTQIRKQTGLFILWSKNETILLWKKDTSTCMIAVWTWIIKNTYQDVFHCSHLMFVAVFFHHKTVSRKTYFWFSPTLYLFDKRPEICYNIMACCLSVWTPCTVIVDAGEHTHLCLISPSLSDIKRGPWPQIAHAGIPRDDLIETWQQDQTAASNKRHLHISDLFFIN